MAEYDPVLRAHCRLDREVRGARFADHTGKKNGAVDSLGIKYNGRF